MHVVLGLVTLAGAAGVVWLLVERGRLSQRVAVALTERDGAVQAHAEAEEERQRALAERTKAGEEITRLASQAAGLQARLEAEEKARKEEKASAHQAFDAALKAESELHAAKLEALDLAKREIENKLSAFDTSLKNAFGTLAADALCKSNEQFLKLATERLGAVKTDATKDMDERKSAIEHILEPMRKTLSETDSKLAALEKERGSAYATLLEQVRAMQVGGAALQAETGKLVKALREPQVRGRYGEIQLRRVAELAGMRAYCDFVEQPQTVGDDGRAKRPDMVVRLPNARELIVDAKANLKPYIDAMEAQTPEASDANLVRFADGVADQAEQLSKRGYFSDYAGSPDFVIMFLPGDGFLDAALARRPDLLDFAAQRNVILASPASLIAMLRAVAVGFKEQKLSDEARMIGSLARELHESISIALAHAAGIGKSLARAQEQWNDFVGSIEGRVLPRFRRIESAGCQSDKPMPELKAVNTPVRTLQSTSKPPDDLFQKPSPSGVGSPIATPAEERE